MEHNKPQPAPKGKGREITPLVIKDLEMRSAMGKEKYGETLRAFNGRDPLVDLYQELIDAVQYIRQLIEEQREKAAEKSEVDEVVAQAVEGMEDPEGKRLLIDETLQGMAPTYTARAFLAEQQRKTNTAFGPIYMIGIDPAIAKESIAQEAHRLVLGDRGEAYGHPIFDMTRTADMLTALLRDKLKTGMRLEAEDIGQAMICVKQSRHRNKAKRDNLTDTAGYALTLQMIAEWRAAHPGVDPRDVSEGV